MPRSLLPALILVLSLPSMASASNIAKISPKVLAQAINEADARAVPYRKAKIAPSDVRITKCVGYEEEPTEFECTWRQHSAHGWVKRKTGLAIDGSGWHVND